MRIGIDIDDTITDTSDLIGQILIENNLKNLSSDFDSNGLEDLNRFENGTVVTPALLKDTGLVKQQYNGIKVLGTGKLEKKITIQANKFSTSALEKIKEAGSKAEVI